ncbi:ATP-binding cassette sub-family F member 3 isoform X1 [Patella vulgata]|uniref:ATP-binding cassette sub-family F member 3 isoform X1 n=1 Tax=Patella vulgata TaxID=6465 RepID=UPI00217F3593|nr:ATP-binding cassette sub-family F member 3 isoform X1 [Patella vulgata]
MAAVGEVLRQSLPEIDNAIADYLNGILEDTSNEFEEVDDLYEAFGEMLHQVDDSKSEDEIREICEKIYNIMVPGGNDSTSRGKMNGQHKILGAPVVIGDVKIDEITEEASSIWLNKRDSGLTTVDKKKLEKAEAKLQMKKEKRDLMPTTLKKVDSGIELASASQQINRRDAKMDASGTNRSLDIKIENFDIAFGERLLLAGADLHLVYGRRYGFIGRNGLGKTTLLKMISSGQLKIPSHISVLHVEQEVVGDDTPAIQSVLECDLKREGLLKQERELNAKLNAAGSGDNDSNLSNKLSEVYHELSAIEADRAPARAAVIMSGLGFSPGSQDRPTKEFSGGWRMRLALARALFTKPDLLLLDEPTNMLDMKAIIWLENYLQQWASTILVVSHDQMFLNSVSTDIVHLQSSKLDTYRGDFEAFKRTREERLKNQMKEYEAQKDYREHLQVFIDRFRYNANRAAQVQSKLKILEKLPPLVPIVKETEVILRFPECESLSPPILQLDEVEFYYSKDQPIFKNICVNALMNSRISIVGENGAGKTTLLKILLGELSPVNGLRHAHRSLRIGYFSQHHVDQLEMNMCSVELLASRFPGKPIEQYRTQLGSFGVSGELAMRPVASLSGGQKSRVAFAVMSLANPNFFILDEPTNHLDMETIEALGHALNKFKGGVVLVSHDERLIRKICKELWVVANGTVTSLEGGIDEYKKIVEAELAVKS